MFTAEDARNAAQAYYNKLEQEEQKQADIILQKLLDDIKNNSEAGLYSYITGNTRDVFKTQNCETRVKVALTNLGFVVEHNPYQMDKLIIKWHKQY